MKSILVVLRNEKIIQVATNPSECGWTKIKRQGKGDIKDSPILESIGEWGVPGSIRREHCFGQQAGLSIFDEIQLCPILKSEHENNKVNLTVEHFRLCQVGCVMHFLGSWLHNIRIVHIQNKYSGQTGAGKTYTIVGNCPELNSDTENYKVSLLTNERGILPRALQRVFD